jgi:hypothetical protein
MVLYPSTCLCFCVLPASALPPTCSCFVFYTQNLSAYCKHRCWMLGTALRALTDPASLSKVCVMELPGLAVAPAPAPRAASLPRARWVLGLRQ